MQDNSEVEIIELLYTVNRSESFSYRLCYTWNRPLTLLPECVADFIYFGVTDCALILLFVHIRSFIASQFQGLYPCYIQKYICLNRMESVS